MSRRCQSLVLVLTFIALAAGDNSASAIVQSRGGHEQHHAAAGAEHRGRVFAVAFDERAR